MKIAICDDQPLMCKEVEKQLQEYAAQNQSEIDIEIFYMGSSLLASEIDFDIIFLDIELEQEHGIEIAEQYIAEHTGHIIFLTSHIEEMPNGYKVRAFRFLIKPIDRTLFEEAIGSAIKEIMLDKQIIVQDNGKDFTIRCSDIYYVEAGSRSCGVRTENGFYRYGKNIQTMQQELDTPNFYVPHKSYIVNMDKLDIRLLDKNGLTMLNGEIVKVSRLKEKEFRDRYFAYIRSK